MSIESAFKLSLINNKASKNGAHYLTLIYKQLKPDNPRTEYISYPAFSKIGGKDTPIKVPVMNANCEYPTSCLFDLDHFIKYVRENYSQKKIEDSIKCPGCPKTVPLKKYLIDYGFEYILRDYEIQPEIKSLAEESKMNTSGFLPLKQTLGPNHLFFIHRDGTYFCYDNELEKLSDLTIIKKMTEKAITDRMLRAALLNDEKASTELLKLKNDYLLAFQNSFQKSLQSSSDKKVKAEFCVSKLLEDPEKRMSHQSYFRNLVFWFPTLNAARQFLQVELCKEDLSGPQSFNYYSYIIKIPEEGCWITGGVQNISGPTVVKDCYQVALKNCTLSGQLRCVKKPDLKKPTFCHAGVCAGEYIYISGGGDGGTLSSETYCINWKNPVEWQSRSPMPKPRIYHSLINIGSKIYCFGGGFQKIEKGSPKFDGNTSVDEYDTNTNKWSTLPLPEKADGITFIPGAYMFVQPLSNREVLIFGGVDPILETSLTGSYIYDLNDKTLRKPKQDVKSLPKGPTDFIDLNSVRTNNTLYFLGPYKSSATKFATTLFYLNLNDHKVEPKRKILDTDMSGSTISNTMMKKSTI